MNKRSFLCVACLVGICFKGVANAEDTCGNIGSSIPTRYTRDAIEAFFLNTDNPAVCNGTITRWFYCHYTPPLVLLTSRRSTFATFRRTDNRFERVSPPVDAEVGIGARIGATFECLTITADPIPVQEGDVIGACVYDFYGSPTHELNVIGNNAPQGSTLKIVEGLDCKVQNHLIPQSVNEGNLTQRDSVVMHVYAEIECPVTGAPPEEEFATMTDQTISSTMSNQSPTISSTANSNGRDEPTISSTANSNGVDEPTISSTANSNGRDEPTVSSTANSNGRDEPTVSSTANSNGVDEPTISSTANSNGRDEPTVSSTANSNGRDEPTISSTANSNGRDEPTISSTANSNGVDEPTISSTANSNGRGEPTISSTANSNGRDEPTTDFGASETNIVFILQIAGVLAGVVVVVVLLVVLTICITLCCVRPRNTNKGMMSQANIRRRPGNVDHLELRMYTRGHTLEESERLSSRQETTLRKGQSVTERRERTMNKDQPEYSYVGRGFLTTQRSLEVHISDNVYSYPTVNRLY